MCTPYRSHWIEFVLPSPYIFDELCISYDKTRMFVNTLFKLIMYWIACTIIQLYSKQTTFMIIIFCILMTIIYINCLAVFIIITKKPKYDETIVSHKTEIKL